MARHDTKYVFKAIPLLIATLTQTTRSGVFAFAAATNTWPTLALLLPSLLGVLRLLSLPPVLRLLLPLCADPANATYSPTDGNCLFVFLNLVERRAERGQLLLRRRVPGVRTGSLYPPLLAGQGTRTPACRLVTRSGQDVMAPKTDSVIEYTVYEVAEKGKTA